MPVASNHCDEFHSALLEKNKNDLFLEGLTGDIVYDVVSPLDVQATNNLEVTDINVGLVLTISLKYIKNQ